MCWNEPIRGASRFAQQRQPGGFVRIAAQQRASRARASRARASLRRREASPRPPKTGRIGEARRGNLRPAREKRAFWPARFTT